jgi:hypothetical protein
MKYFLITTAFFLTLFVINWNINPCYPLEWFAIGYILALTLPLYIKRITK